MNELTIGDKIYISSKRAAEITGYAKDYVGQLCREGHVEAKMVGRSWYVLESSIRAHRFGAVEEPAVKEGSVIEESKPASDPLTTWERPRYVAEESVYMPKFMPIEPKPVAHETAQSLEMSSDRTLAEMQGAWKEWFNSRGQSRFEPSEVTAANEREQEDSNEPELVAPVPIIRVVEGEGESVPITVHRPVEPLIIDLRGQASAPAPVQHHFDSEASRTVYEPIPTATPAKSSLIATALLIAIAGVVIAVGVVGTGFAESYIGENTIVEYLGGERTISK